MLSYLFLEIEHKAMFLGEDEKTGFGRVECNFLHITFTLGERL
jgi:hypothetical protein